MTFFGKFTSPAGKTGTENKRNVTNMSKMEKEKTDLVKEKTDKKFGQHLCLKIWTRPPT